MIPELYLSLRENQQLSAKKVMAIPAIRVEKIPAGSSKGVESNSGTINWGATIRAIPVLPSRRAVSDRNVFIL